jgi:hypothetical protein
MPEELSPAEQAQQFISEGATDNQVAIKIVFKDEIVDGIPSVSIELEAPGEAQEFDEPTPAMWCAVYILRLFYEGKFIPAVAEFVASGEFAAQPAQAEEVESANPESD